MSSKKSSASGKKKKSEKGSTRTKKTLEPDNGYVINEGTKFDLTQFIKDIISIGKPKKEDPTNEEKPKGPLRQTLAGYTIQQLHILLNRVMEFYRSNKCALLEISAPVNICGDTHGQYHDLKRIFRACGAPTKTKYLFLGDYIDRGTHSLEVICLLFALKLAVPNKVHLLRGNHELRPINYHYGFHGECRNRMRSNTPGDPEQLYRHFNEVFSYMPMAAVVSSRILCMHGGISPALTSLQAIRDIPLPMETVKTHQLASDLLWADPDERANGFEPNRIRAISHIFGKAEVDRMLDKLDLDLIVRGHQVVEYGYAFFADRRLITVFSASRYQDELRNYAAVVRVSKELELSFVQLKPEEYENWRDDYERNGKEEVTGDVPQKNEEKDGKKDEDEKKKQ